MTDLAVVHVNTKNIGYENDDLVLGVLAVGRGDITPDSTDLLDLACGSVCQSTIRSLERSEMNSYLRAYPHGGHLSIRTIGIKRLKMYGIEMKTIDIPEMQSLQRLMLGTG